MKIWNLVESTHRDAETGDLVRTFHAELQEQPLWAYLRGRLIYQTWKRCPRWVTNHHGHPWLVRLEIACMWDILNKRRHLVEMVRVADRDPNTWFLPGGDAPLRLEKP